MALRKGLPAKLALTDADDTRYVFSGLVVANADGTPRGGVLSPVGTNLVTATGTMNVSVARFQGAAVRDAGVVLLANDGPANVLLDAAPGANSRIDVVYAKQNDSSGTVSVPDGDDLPVFGVLKGVAAGSPVRNPAGLPAGALELATVLIPSTATATNSGGVVITQTAQFTAAAGGVVHFRTKSDLDLWTTAGAEQRAVNLADGQEWVRRGSSWVAPGPTVTHDFIPYSQRATLTTLKTLAFASVPYATEVDIRFDGILADGTGAAHSARVTFAASAGTLTVGVNQPVLVPLNQVAAHVVAGLLAIPASTAVTLTVATSGTNTYYEGLLKTVRAAV